MLIGIGRAFLLLRPFHGPPRFLRFSRGVHFSVRKSWDVCAADAVMKASGGGFSDIEGKPLWYPMEYDRFVERR